MKNSWFQNGNDFFLKEVQAQIGNLPKAVYKTMEHPVTGELYLSHVSDRFEFPYKVYGIESSFISRVKKTYDNTESNLGILLNGIKGTGKTVTAEMIANELNQPVIIVTAAFNNLADFISRLQQNTTIFFDEYEKMFSDYESGNSRKKTEDDYLLSVMDGALNGTCKKVFILTTNNKYVNDNFIQRPGRIRYKKEFKDLPVESIIEIVTDRIKDKALIDTTVKFISELELITVDIVKAITDEVNIHDETPDKFENVFNIEKLDVRFNVYDKKVKEGEKYEIRFPDAKLQVADFSKYQRGQRFYIDGSQMGIIKKGIIP